jgi:hypothetical protein
MWVSLEIPARERGYRSGERKRLQIPTPTTDSDPNPDPVHWRAPDRHCRKPMQEKEATNPEKDRSVWRHIPTPTTNPNP